MGGLKTRLFFTLKCNILVKKIYIYIKGNFIHGGAYEH